MAKQSDNSNAELDQELREGALPVSRVKGPDNSLWNWLYQGMLLARGQALVPFRSTTVSASDPIPPQTQALQEVLEEVVQVIDGTDSLLEVAANPGTSSASHHRNFDDDDSREGPASPDCGALLPKQ